MHHRNALTVPITLVVIGASAPAQPVVFPSPRIETGATPMCIAVGDLDGDGDLDTVTANAEGSSVSVILHAADRLFEPRIDLAVNAGPMGVALGDVDGDGDLDIVVSSSLADTVSVLLNNSDATFAFPIVYATGDEPRGVALSDLDGDGELDVVIANRGSDSIGVLLNLGGGSLAAQLSFAAGDGPLSVCVGDLNGDALPDLVTVDELSDTIGVVLATGPASYAAPMFAAAPDQPQHAALTDIDADGDLDVVLASFSNTISIFRGDGVGGLGARQDLVQSSGPRGVGVADMNSDGRPDLVSVNENTGNVTVFLNDASQSFSARASYRADNKPRSIAMADMDGDGRWDAVLCASSSSGHSALVLMNNGTGGFAARESFLRAYEPNDDGLGALADVDGDAVLELVVQERDRTDIYRNTDGLGAFELESSCDLGGTKQPVVRDLNDDGAPDLATWWDNGFAIALNSGDGTFGPQRRFGTSTSEGIAVGDVDGDGLPEVLMPAPGGIRIIRNHGAGVFASWRAFDFDDFAGFVLFTAGDLDADGDVDIAGLYGSPYSYLAVLLNDGTGALVEAPRPTGIISDSRDIAHADFDGDGAVDLCIAGTFIAVRYGVGDGTFGPPTPVVPGPTAAPQAKVCLADLDADGDPDIVYRSSQPPHGVITILKDGDRTFAAPVHNATTKAYGDGRLLDTADVDGDSDIDVVLIVPNASPPMVDVFTNAGDGTLSAPQALTLPISPNGMRIADTDGDGDNDVALVSTFSHKYLVLRNDGAGGFSIEPMVTLEEYPTKLATADVNADGFIDLVFSHPDGYSFVFGSASGELSPPEFHASLSEAANSTAKGLRILDMDTDGDPDLFTSNTDWTAWLPNLGSGSFDFETVVTGASLRLGPTPPTNDSIAAGDLNGDGHLDVVTSEAGVTVWTGDGTGNFTSASLGSSITPKWLHLGDADNDGDLDLGGLQRGPSNSFVLWLNDGTGGLTASPELLSLSGGNFNSLQIEDFTEDGVSDLVYLANAKNFPGAINSAEFRPGLGDGTFGSAQFFTTDDGLIQHGGDIDGDGDRDLIVMNPTYPVAGILRNQVVSSTPTPACDGDINGDGFTNASDFVVLAGNFGASVTPNTNGDLNGDGLVNAADFVILAGDFGCAS